MKILLPVTLLLVLSPPVTFAEGNRDIFKALIKATSVKVPPNNLHCEINGTRTDKDGSVIYNDVTVGDFLASYTSWSLQDQGSNFPSFTCEGNTPRKCHWGYGEKADSRNPGWQVFLNFNFDPRTGKVDPDSLECIQVP